MYRFRGPTLCPRLEGTAQGDEGDDHPRGLEEDGLTGRYGPDRVEVGGQRSERYQSVHVGAEMTRLAGSHRMELPADPGNNGGNQDPLEKMVPELIGPQHGQSHRWKSQGRAEPEALPLHAFFVVIVVHHVPRVLFRSPLGEPVSDLAHRLGEGLAVCPLTDTETGRGSSQIHRGCFNALLATEDPFDPDRASGTCHPVDVELDRFGVGRRALPQISRRLRSPAPRSSA